MKTNPIGVKLSQQSILEILHSSESVTVGTEIWENPEEYKKLEKIINTAVFWTIQKMRGNNV